MADNVPPGYTFKTVYSAVCSRCPAIYEWCDDLESAELYAEAGDWEKQDDGTWVCFDCQCDEINAEDDAEGDAEAEVEPPSRPLWPNGATDRDGDWLEDEL